MGEVNQGFCDGCKKEIVDVTYSQNGQTGVVKFKITVWKEGATVEGISGDLCQACYDKMKNWFAAKKTAAGRTWAVPTPATKVVIPPTL
jgi:hypothetical protein